MVDTFEVFSRLNQVQLDHLEQGLGIAHHELKQITASRHNHITLRVSLGEPPIFDNYVYVLVNVPHMLGKGDVLESDRSYVEEQIAEMLHLYFGDRNLFNTMKLRRFDYRLDVKIDSEEKRQLYITLMDRARPKLRRMSKLGKLAKNGQCQSKYKTSIVHKAKSVVTTVYDKSVERKKKRVKAEDWEESVLRYEVRLHKRHIDYKSTNGVLPILASYWTSHSYKNYLTEYLLKLYFDGDYFTSDLAEELIREQNLTEKMKWKLIVVLDSIKYGNINTPKTRMSDATYRKYLKMYQDMKLNPCLIRKKEKKVAHYLPNLLSAAINNIK